MIDLQIAPWIILFTPLVAATLIFFFGKMSKLFSAGVAIAAAATTCFLSWQLFLHPTQSNPGQFLWLDSASLFPLDPRFAFQVPIGLTMDALSRTMLVIVSTIATLVFIYSVGYMAAEEGYWRYFAGLALFLFSMLGIVLADNFVMMFIFWELVGVSSYILIGHYFKRDSAAEACKQAFIVNRIGDFGFMLGILVFWYVTGYVTFTGIQQNLSAFSGASIALWVACLLIFCGTIGKSAQLPLHVWLPNSMEGPTPVSSLLHAATMVAAGVYMLARFFGVIESAPLAREVIAWIGGITALAAGLMATQQNDIKRILAYSTISQLGYMVLGIGVAPSGDVAMFHLFTHASFKCMLFLCAGSVIIAMHHEQDIWQMGGLWRKMPITFITFLVGLLALSGCPGLSGYFSKDLIIAFTLTKSMPLFIIAVVSAWLTAFYMVRMGLVVFAGQPRSEAANHTKESPVTMVVPLVLLAIPSALAGYGFIANHFFKLPHPHLTQENLLNMATLSAFGIGVFTAFLMYRGAPKEEPVVVSFFANRLGIDTAYDWLVQHIQEKGAMLSAWIDRWVIDGFLVQFVLGRLMWIFGFILRFLQVGNIQAYAFFFGVGVLALVYFFISGLLPMR